MAMNAQHSRPWLVHLHFLLRLLGLLGLLAVVAGLVLSHVALELDNPWEEAGNKLHTALTNPEADPLARVGVYLLVGGGVAAVLALLVELVGITRLTAGRRSAEGANVVVQLSAAAALLVGVNLYSFLHFDRMDCTRPDPQTGQKAFTLPEDVQEQMGRLRGETTIVVLQQRRKDDRDDRLEDYESAAEAIVVEKVRDLADQLRFAGAEKLRVIQLDTRRRDYRGRLSEVTQSDPKLRKAIESASGNSIIFHSSSGKGADHREEFQRISFDDFLQLDRTLSKQADDGKGNLVLLDKGLKPVTTRIFNLEERRPRIGILTTHEAFTSERPNNPIGLSGLKATLERYGFDVRDISLKRELRLRSESGAWVGEPAVDLLEETKYKKLKLMQGELPTEIQEGQEAIQFFEKQRGEWEKLAGEALIREAGRNGATNPKEFREKQLTNWGNRIEAARREVDDLKKQLEEANKELAAIDVDLIEEQLHTSDLSAKFERVVSDCDLMLVVRPSIWRFNLPDNGSFHQLEDFQVRGVRNFLRAGKPLLVCSGPWARVMLPPRIPGQPPTPPEDPRPDGLERLLRELGIGLARDPIVYTSQKLDPRADPFSDDTRKIPSLDLTTPPDKLDRPDFLSGRPKIDSPLRRSLMLTARSWGGELDLPLTYPGAAYYNPRPSKLPEGLKAPPPLSENDPSVEFLWTQASAWNTDQPRNPTRHIPPKESDPTYGTIDQRRAGAFPIGVAVEAKLPSDWSPYGDGAKSARVVVIGDGLAFAEVKLTPAREKLLLDTCNWLLGRDDLLTKDVPTWEYPRLHDLNERDRSLWLWGTRLGLPVLFAFLGLVVLLARRVR